VRSSRRRGFAASETIAGVQRNGGLSGSVGLNLEGFRLVNARFYQVPIAAIYLKDVNANGTESLAEEGLTNAGLT
jgi:hypothetical protein